MREENVRRLRREESSPKGAHLNGDVIVVVKIDAALDLASYVDGGEVW